MPAPTPDPDPDLVQVLLRPQSWHAEPADQLPRLRRELLPFLARWRLTGEEEMLREAPLYQVDRDVTLMGVAFGQVPAGEPLQARHLPSETGLMVFDEPIGGVRQTLGTALGYNTGFRPPSWLDPDSGFDIPIVAATWQRRTTGAGDGLDVAFYTPRTGNLWSRLPADTVVGTDTRWGHRVTAGQMARFQDAEAVALGTPDLVWHRRHRVRLGEAPAVPEHRATARAWMQVLYAVWQLHALVDTGAVSDTEALHVSRTERKRDARAGIADTRVAVVRLHSRHRPTPRAGNARGPARVPLDHRVPVGLHREYKCLNTHRHHDDWQNRTDACRHEDRPVRFHLRGPQGAPIGHRVNWLTFRVRPRRPDRARRRATDTAAPASAAARPAPPPAAPSSGTTA